MSSASASDTFVEDVTTTTTKPQQQQQPPPSSPSSQPLQPTTIASTITDSYFDLLDAKYQAKIKAAAQLEKYLIQLNYEDGRTEKQEYVRMKVLQWQFDEIQEMIAKLQESTANTSKSVETFRHTTALYKKAAGYYLFNTKTQKPMSVEEYNHCYTSEIRPVLDAAIRLTLLSDPN